MIYDISRRISRRITRYFSNSYPYTKPPLKTRFFGLFFENANIMDFAELFDFNSPIYEPQLLEFSEIGDLAPTVANESEYFADVNPPTPGR